MFSVTTGKATADSQRPASTMVSSVTSAFSPSRYSVTRPLAYFSCAALSTRGSTMLRPWKIASACRPSGARDYTATALRASAMFGATRPWHQTSSRRSAPALAVTYQDTTEWPQWRSNSTVWSWPVVDRQERISALARLLLFIAVKPEVRERRHTALSPYV